MSDTTLIKLTNPAFQVEYDGKEYSVRKANLEKVVQYIQRFDELKKVNDEAGETKILAYCFYLILKDEIPELTEDDVLKKIPGNLDIVDSLSMLGFINPEKAKTAKQLQSGVINRLTTLDSSLPSQTKPDGAPVKSETLP